MTACRNTAADCIIFRTVCNSWLRQQFRRYQVLIRYYWASASMTKGNRLSKRKRNVLRRDDYFYFHHYSFQICITDKAWGGQYDWIYGQISFFSHFARLSKSPLFFPGWLCHETCHSLGRWATSCIDPSSSSLNLRTYERSTWNKSSLLLTEKKSCPMKKDGRNIQLSWPKKLGQ